MLRKIDAKKLFIMLARRQMSAAELQAAARITANTMKRIADGGGVQAVTAGKIADALEIDVTEILMN
ncbi:MAG: helix-turn-helix domain-containing protein [Acidaminococcaceae bacterium]|nr:helix-turn-helix domain-containing protein [Acidaminococcaceae bacterium]